MFRLADPGTVTLVRASSTIITAAILRLFLARCTRELQWHALIVQLLALAVSQMGSYEHYSVSTYALLIAMTTLSSVAAVINDVLSALRFCVR